MKKKYYKYTVWCIFKLASYKRTHTEMTPRRVDGSSWVFLCKKSAANASGSCPVVPKNSQASQNLRTQQFEICQNRLPKIASFFSKNNSIRLPNRAPVMVLCVPTRVHFYTKCAPCCPPWTSLKSPEIHPTKSHDCKCTCKWPADRPRKGKNALIWWTNPPSGGQKYIFFCIKLFHARMNICHFCIKLFHAS